MFKVITVYDENYYLNSTAIEFLIISVAMIIMIIRFTTIEIMITIIIEIMKL